MKLKDYHTLPLQECQTLCGEVIEEEVEEDDDGEETFWEAVDLLESASKSMRAVLRDCQDLSIGRRKLLLNLCDDIKLFLDDFVIQDDEQKS